MVNPLKKRVQCLFIPIMSRASNEIIYHTLTVTYLVIGGRPPQSTITWGAQSLLHQTYVTLHNNWKQPWQFKNLSRQKSRKDEQPFLFVKSQLAASKRIWQLEYRKKNNKMKNQINCLKQKDYDKRGTDNLLEWRKNKYRKRKKKQGWSFWVLIRYFQHRPYFSCNLRPQIEPTCAAFLLAFGCLMLYGDSR